MSNYYPSRICYMNVKTATYDYDQEILTVKTCDGGVHQYDKDYYTWPMMEGVSSGLELRLRDVKRYIDTHGNPYPTAHLKGAINE